MCKAKGDKETVYSQRGKRLGLKDEKKQDACTRGEQRVGTTPGPVIGEAGACERVVLA